MSAFLVGAVATTAAASTASDRRPQRLSFAERVLCQERIEEVYWRHRLWPGAPGRPRPDFHDVVSREALSRRAEDALLMSAALERLWRRPIAATQLQAEVDRMARRTQAPARLAELFTALDDDPFLAAECLARPILTQRLVRSFYAADPRFHEATREGAERALAALVPADDAAGVGAAGEQRIVLALGASGDAEWDQDLVARAGRAFGLSRAAPDALRLERFSPLVEEPERFVAYAARRGGEGPELVIVSWPKRTFEDWWSEARGAFAGWDPAEASAAFALPPLTDGGGCAADTWTPTAGDVPDPREHHSAVWTGSEMIVWGGQAFPVALASGARYDPATDTWTPTSMAAAPSARYLHAAVWTGTRMIVWGGVSESGTTSTGGLYDPVSDAWTPTSTGDNVPSARHSHAAVWTGSEMVVWGGGFPSPPYVTGTGGRYDPSSDTWTATATGGAPSARSGATAVWTGSEMIVWGGEDYPDYFGDGARYDPSGDSWSAVSTNGAPPVRSHHTVVWTGSEMIVWGGTSTTAFVPGGARYRPQNNKWTAMSTAGAPSARYDHSAVWTGSEMIVWGGLVGVGVRSNTGGGYDPGSNSWASVPTGAGVPQARMRHSAVWTGSEMIVWGGDDYGFDGFIYLQSGGRYAPASGSWVPIAAGASTPEARRYHATVWTGSEMIVWGGFGSALLDSGGRYDPALDAWTATSRASGVPSARVFPGAVWTGTTMVVWGGSDPFDALATGGRYDPALDGWTATSTLGTPSPRAGHTSVFTGREMIVAGRAGDVGLYDPDADAWTTSTAPEAWAAERSGQVATWTGSEMLLWGGRLADGALAPDGLRYDPLHDVWAPLSGAGGPPPSDDASAVWTGSEMIVWGGRRDGGVSAEGGRLDPASGAWTPMSVAGAPAARQYHTAAWTGNEMIVWGGAGNSGPPFADGARYDPAADAWAEVASVGSPRARSRHGAIFTDRPGERMVVWGGLPNASSGGAYCAPCTAVLWHVDGDADGHGTAGGTTSACTQPLGYAPVADDCDDADPDRFPGNVEICDGKDSDCNDVVDDADPPAAVAVLFSSDGDAIDLSWPRALAADAYDVTRGSAGVLNRTGGDFAQAADLCLADDTVGLSATDDALPPAGDAFWYVVRAVNCAGGGTYDSGGPAQQGSRDPGLDASPDACP